MTPGPPLGALGAHIGYHPYSETLLDLILFTFLTRLRVPKDTIREPIGVQRAPKTYIQIEYAKPKGLWHYTLTHYRPQAKPTSTTPPVSP